MAGQGKYGDWIALAPNSPSTAKLRIFCVAPVGMSGACFHPWAAGLPRGVELMPLELPGRGFRMAEKLQASSLKDLAAAALDGIGRPVFEEVAFAIFGHSFGAWLAYELAQQLRARGWCIAHSEILVSAAQDPDRVQPELSRLGEEDFWHHFERRYGKNPDLQESYIRGFIRPVLQGDFSLLETYVPSSLEKLSVPLCALCAIGDRRCRPEQLSAWRDVADAGFQERWFQNVWKPEFWSTEHRYIVDNPKSLLAFLSEDLPVLGCPGGAEDTGIDGPRVSDFGEDSAPESAPEPRRCCIS